MNIIENTELSSEEYLGPPKIDSIGLLLALFLSLVVGLIVGGSVFLLIYMFSGEFLFESGVLSIVFGMIAFIGLSLGNYLFIFGITTIFSHIYTATRTLFVQISVFSIVLYILMSVVYFYIGTAFSGKTGVISVYAIHAILNSFGVLLLLSLLTYYRYSLLAFYSSLVSCIFTALAVFVIFVSLNESGAMIFMFLGLTTTTCFFATLLYFGSMYLYHQMYKFSGSDLLGDTLSRVQNEEREIEKQAEYSLLK